MSESVLVSVNKPDRTRYHSIENGQPACGIGKKDGHEFETVSRENVTDLGHCQHCSGDSPTAGQGGTLTAQLAAADADEVNAR